MSSYKCKTCVKPTFYQEGRDSYFCAICNTWNEPKCSDSECGFCVYREEQPLEDSAHEIVMETYHELGFEYLGELIDYYFEIS